jgi:hypothetical protein
MSRLNAFYGSELHLLRYLGRHRDDLNARITGELGGGHVEWVDFEYDQIPDDRRHSRQSWDTELKAVDFLSDRPDVRSAWNDWWPQGPGTITWDAVGRWHHDGGFDWLLVEAKAHVQELWQRCQARQGDGLRRIQRAFQCTKEALGVDADRDWELGCYQYCNRISTLYFLHTHGVSARLLFIYFTGDRRTNADCPRTADEWYEQGLKPLKTHVGLTQEHLLSRRIHELFLPVRRLVS